MPKSNGKKTVPGSNWQQVFYAEEMVPIADTTVNTQQSDEDRCSIETNAQQWYRLDFTLVFPHQEIPPEVLLPGIQLGGKTIQGNALRETSSGYLLNISREKILLMDVFYVNNHCLGLGEPLIGAARGPKHSPVRFSVIRKGNRLQVWMDDELQLTAQALPLNGWAAFILSGKNSGSDTYHFIEVSLRVSAHVA